ncbi:MAG: hypothetical protein QM775_11230 [Pirellulales bacterium]
MSTHPDDSQLPTDAADVDELETEADREAQAAADKVSHDRVWSDPLSTGDPVPFDSENFEPRLTPEELQALKDGKGE